MAFRASGKKIYSKIAPDFGLDTRRFEGNISGIFTTRSNAVAGPSDKRGWDRSFFPMPLEQRPGRKQVAMTSLLLSRAFKPVSKTRYDDLPENKRSTIGKITPAAKHPDDRPSEF
jgi:hypothetical protein